MLLLFAMKKILISLIFWLVVFVAPGYAQQYYAPPIDEAIQWLDTRAQNEWYHLPVVRKFLMDAYYDPQYKEHQSYLVQLIREVEAVSEEKYRVPVWFELNEDRTLANMYGQIGEDIYTKVRELIMRNPNLDTIKLIYVPGSHHDINNHKAGRLIRTSWINTYIPSYWFIASGGTDILMAGNNRKIGKGAQIWVHAWTSSAYPEPRNLRDNDAAHNEYISYFTDMWVSEDLYRWTLDNTRPGTIHRMTQEEIQEYWF